MNDLVARQALSSTTVRVQAESRLADVIDMIEQKGATHAVVTDGEDFQGVISLRAALLSNTRRIFADLLGGVPIPAVKEETSLQEVARKMEAARADAVQVLSADGVFAGIVTRNSLLDSSLEEANRRFDEIRRLRGQQERLRVLGQMVCGVAHDLNNLLTPIILELEMIRRANGKPADNSRRAEVALTAARDSAAAIERLQEFYRGAEGGRDRKLVDLSRIVAEVRELTRVKWGDEPWSADRNIDFVLDLGNVPPVAVSPGAIREVLVNLVFNAVDAIEGDGVVMVRVRAKGDSVAIEVSDNGRGMIEEERGRCFEPFFTTKGDRGTGLGLSVSREIVLAHGGRIDVSSVPQKGTSFLVTLPTAQVPPRAPEPEAYPALGDLGGLRVLFAENTTVVRSTITALLEQLGLEVDSVANVDEGRDRLRSARYDLLLTDLSMPHESGRALCRAARQINPQIVVLVITGWSASSLPDTPEALDFADDVLEKPFGIEELQAALARITVRRPKG